MQHCDWSSDVCSSDLCWLDDYKISDRAIAEKLGRKQRTFADQMKKIRTELRKIRGY